MPTTALAFVANSPALGSSIGQATNQNLTVDGNTGGTTNGPVTNGPSTNSSGSTTNRDIIYCCAGQRR